MKKITTILWDLDGTLLPMDMDLFMKAYFGGLGKALAPHGYDPVKLAKDVWDGTYAMMKNDGSRTNEEAFWKRFAEIYGEDVIKDMPLFEKFYNEEFYKVQSACGFTPYAKKAIEVIKKKGLRTALATNPYFPETATLQRIRWTGLEPEDFEWITTYENSCYCKPNPHYFLEFAKHLNVDPEECLMIGNDVVEDGAAAAIGMQVYFITDTIINKDNKDLSGTLHGSFEECVRFLESL